MELKEALKRLAELRRDAATAREAVARAQLALDAMPEAQVLVGLKDKRDALDDQAEEAKELAKKLDLEVFLATHNKAPAIGASIKEMTECDHDVAIERPWCVTNMPICLVPDPKHYDNIRGLCQQYDALMFLTVDTRQLESLCSKMPDSQVPFVRRKVPRAEISKDLSAYLAEDEACITDDQPDGTHAGAAGGIHEPQPWDRVPPETPLEHATAIADRAFEADLEAQKAAAQREAEGEGYSQHLAAVDAAENDARGDPPPF